MSSPIQFLRKLLDAGVDLTSAMLAAEQFEQEIGVGLTLRRQKDAARQRSKRSKDHVMSRDSRDERDKPLETKVSPTPPSKTQILIPPSPPKGGSSPTIDDLVQQIYDGQPPKFRRSPRPDIRRALIAAIGRGGHGPSVLAACLAYYRRPENRENDGKFAKAAHRLIENDRWKDFLPTPEPPAKPADAAVIAARIQHFRDTREWKPEWGEQPQGMAA